MPKIAKELGPIKIKNLTHSGKNSNPERHNVGGVSGLMIQITPNNAKSWLLRTTIAGKRKFLGFGPYPEVSLKEARERAAIEKQKIREGLDPSSERKAAKAALIAKEMRGVTFNAVKEEYLNTKLQGKSEKTQRTWRGTLKYTDDVIGNMLVEDIEVHDILRVLEPIWKTKTATASRVRGRIEAILTFAMVKGYRPSGDNPARWKGHLREILPMPSEISNVTHMPAVQVKEASEWFSCLQKRDGIASRALEFLALNGTRSGGVRSAKWQDIDFKTKIWTIPIDETKMKRAEHRVPLSDSSIQLLKQLPRFEGSEYVFPAARGGKLSDMALSACIKRIHAAEIDAGRRGFIDGQTEKPAVPHGLRSTFRDWSAEETNYPREIVELCLEHDIAGSVERAYRRSDILEKRREIMNDWSLFLRS